MIDIPADYGEKRRLTLQIEATELVSIVASPDGRQIRLGPTTAAAWKKMRDTASGEGIILLAISGFRSVERQTEIIQTKLATGEALDSILKEIAAPGYSEHHTGRAIDIGIPDEPPLTDAFALTRAFRWLLAYAPEFGFSLSYPKGNIHGFAFEPWHWLHDGRSLVSPE